MKNFITLIICTIAMVYGFSLSRAASQTVAIIDNSDFSITPASPVAVNYSVKQIQGDISTLQARDTTWTQRIAQDQAQIASENATLYQGVNAGIVLPVVNNAAVNGM